MPRKPIPPTFQQWFDDLAEAAGRVALDKLGEMLDGVSLADLLRPAAPAPGRVSGPTPSASALAAAAAVLGVTPTAPRAVVDAAYRVQAAATHPDRGTDAKDKANRTREFRRVTLARDTLYHERGWK